MGYETIIFDLDGTLTDSALGITNSVQYALNKFGIEVNDKTELYKFVGPPLLDSFESYCGFSKEKAETAVGYYREYYKDKGIFENAVYENIEDLLKILKCNQKTLLVATSKPQHFATIILEHFKLANYFEFIAGSNLDGTRVKKGEVIQYALESCSITDLSKTVMIGDRKHDIIGAKEAGIHSIGVLYGYGGRNELQNAGADYIAGTVDDIVKIIIGK